ncbi:MAG: TonB-dependent receptor [Phenylobacterium sp.]|uniref:TonB-dependent receptor plug domain-containing protein n=1 Tax=Phenylobacterium sp. TaxID=1871053 RepID=UPI0025F3B52D|nr:TonB-dependent receptor [Phenylobacterium sp.]MCG9914761.1 TonB-dependent receptor [Phenylobacterium sp.]
MFKSFLFAGAAAGLALTALPASAQSIDYGSLELLFNEPVTTSATGSPQRSSQAPVDMDIISADEIRRSGATDLPTILSRVAGVDVQAWSAGHTDVGVRGYNQARSARLLVLVNGRQAYLDHYGYTAWTTLPVRLEEIRQIEVVKGPNSALFGFNAVAGVVNIITYNPKFDDESFATVRAGTGDYQELALGQTLKLGERLSARLTAGSSKEDEWDNNTGSLDRLFLDPERLTANVDAVAQLSDKVELRVEGGYASTIQTDIISTYAYAPAKYLNHSVKGTLSWDSQFGLIQASAYQNDLTVKTEIAAVPTRYENTIQVFSLQNLFKVGAQHTFRVGVEQRNNEMPTAPMPGGIISYDVMSVSGMWNWQVSDTLSLTAAARHDALDLQRQGRFPVGLPPVTNALWDRSLKETTYNLGAVWSATPSDTFRATYARGVQLPTLVDLGGLQLVAVTPTFRGAFTGNPTLDPTVVTNFGLGYSRDMPQIGGKVGIKLFAQKSEDVKGQPNGVQADSPATPISLPVYSFVNIGESEMRGFELTAEGQVADGFHWSANYVFTDIEDSADRGYNTAIRYAAFSETTPEHRANVNIGWANELWSVDTFARFEGDKSLYYNAALQPVEGHMTFAGRIARELPNGMTLAVSGQNLLDDAQRQTSGLAAERRVFMTLSKDW